MGCVGFVMRTPPQSKAMVVIIILVGMGYRCFKVFGVFLDLSLVL